MKLVQLGNSYNLAGYQASKSFQYRSLQFILIQFHQFRNSTQFCRNSGQFNSGIKSIPEFRSFQFNSGINSIPEFKSVQFNSGFQGSSIQFRNSSQFNSIPDFRAVQFYSGIEFNSGIQFRSIQFSSGISPIPTNSIQIRNSYQFQSRPTTKLVFPIPVNSTNSTHSTLATWDQELTNPIPSMSRSKCAKSINSTCDENWWNF
jgi:hypothetical protein